VECPPPEGSLQTQACLPSPVQVLDKGFEGPLPPKSFLNALCCGFAPSDVRHEALALAFRAEASLEANHNRCEFLCILHQTVLPPLHLHDPQDEILDFGPGAEPLFRKVLRDFASNACLYECCLLLTHVIKRGFDRVSCFVLDENLGDTTTPTLVVADGKKSFYLRIVIVQLSSLVEDVSHDRSIDCFVQSVTNYRPELLSKVLEGDSVAVANLADPDCLQNTARSQLVLHNLFLEVFRPARKYRVGFDAAHVPWRRIVDHEH